jgi:hypothetical protein
LQWQKNGREGLRRLSHGLAAGGKVIVLIKAIDFAASHDVSRPLPACGWLLHVAFLIRFPFHP